MKSDDKSQVLLQYANHQCGYFTAKQAIACGFTQKNHCYYYRNGHWLHISKGLYRLPDYPDTQLSRWARWLLWSRNNEEIILGALCGASALSFFQLVNTTLQKTHLLLPERQRKRGADSALILHTTSEPQAQPMILQEGWLRVVSPIEAVADSMKLFLSANTYESALEQAKALQNKLVNGVQSIEYFMNQHSNAEVSDAVARPAVDAQATATIEGANTPRPGRPRQLARRRKTSPAATPHAATPLPPDSLTASGGPASTDNAQEERGMPITGVAVAWPDNLFSPLQRERRLQGIAREFRAARATFTLVEMLVVISIIAILAALLMPALNRALGSSRQLVCANNLKTLGIAHTQYQSDFNGFLGHCVYTDDGSLNDGVYYGWIYKLQPYLGYPVGSSSKPSNPGQRGNILTCGENPEGEFNGNFSSFAVNANLGAGIGSICRYPAYKLTKFASPSGKLYLFDGGGYRTRDMDFCATGGPGSNLLRFRHNDGASLNGAFLDGHVKAYGVETAPYVYNNTGAYWLNPAYPTPSGL